MVVCAVALLHFATPNFTAVHFAAIYIDIVHFGDVHPGAATMCNRKV